MEIVVIRNLEMSDQSDQLNKELRKIIMKENRGDKKLQEQLIAVQGVFITLGQLLKVAGIIDSGGAAKFYLSETPVLVNGEQEQRRGRKLYPGDLVVAPDTVT